MEDPSSWSSAGTTTAYKFKVSEELWTYAIVDLYDALDGDSDMVSMYNSGKGRLKRVGMYLPTLTDGKSLDLAYVAYFDNETVADYFGADASAYMNGGKTVTAEKVEVTLSDRNWSGGNNLAFGMLYSSQGGGWSNGIYGGSSTNTSSGYDTWRVGYDLLNGYGKTSNTTRQSIFGKPFTKYYTVSDSKTANNPTSGTTNNIFYVSSSSDDGNSSSGFDMSKLDLDGYQLLTTLTQGGMTAGLLEGTLENGMPVYRQEAVEYIAMDLGGAHSISNESFEVNDYVEWARDIVESVEAANGDLEAAGVSAGDYDRAKKLDLTEGEICQFDFYYMERHGYGANCRIVTNMRVTDPELRTEKTASQTIEKKVDEETTEKIVENIPYGGVVDYEKPIAYYFKMSNTGNTKLYNLTFEDNDIGVTLDYINGLQVTGTYQGESVNGSYVLDSENGILEAKDLTADVVGYELVGEGNGSYNKTADGQYVKAEGGMYEYAEVKGITFADNDALIRFLKTLDAEGTDNEKVDAELTQNGAGLWVDASVTINGIHFIMNDDQVKAGYFDNTVYVSATTRTDPNESDNRTLRSRANHRVYISGAPAYYQWAGHDLYLTEELIFSDATKAAGNGTGGQLSQYGDFFKKANNKVSNIKSVLCDNSGKVLDNKYYGDLVQWESANKGLLVNFKETGTQVFYMYMYLIDSLRADSTKIQDGEFAIVRVTVHVADVANSTFVLDYGLKTENLDTYGELFKDDNLLSSVAGTTAKLMAVAKEQPSYLDYTNNKSGSYNRIKFNPFQLSSTTRLFTHNNEMDSHGAWTVNLDIPESGRVITYNANTGGYSLTDIGTVTIHANVPFTWDDVYLYWWYDNGISNDTFPGKEMARTRAGKFVMDIPADVPHVIISHLMTDEQGNAITDSNGNPQYLQTSDLNLSMGKEAWIELSGATNVGGRLAADVFYSMNTSTMHAVVPDNWGDVYLYYWNETGEEGVDYPAWPGTQVTDPDGDGRYSLTEIPGNITHVIVNNGGKRNEDKQTNSLSIYAGRETTITVKNSYKATTTVSSEERQTFTVRVNVPEDWNSANLYYWNNGAEGNFGKGWPGTAMTKNEDGSYSLEVPNQAEYVIVNSENGQTVDLPIVSGKDVTLSLGDKNGDGKFTSGYEYAGTFTLNVIVPDSWVANGENINLHYWNSFNLVSGTEWPGETMTKNADGTYSLTVPNYANYIIVNNGSVQTSDYKLPATSANMITLEVGENKAVSVVNEATVAVDVSVPDSWGGVYLYYWNDTGVEGVDYPAWPGTAMFANGSKYELTIPGSMTGMIVNSGEARDAGNQTGTLTVPDSGNVSVEIKEICATASTISNSTVTNETFKVTVQVPESWTANGEPINLHHWKSGGSSSEWPGVPMTKNEDGTFSLEISSENDYVIINNGAVQTSDLAVVSGKDVFIKVNEDYSVLRTYEGTYTVNVTVPASWGDNINLYYCNEAMGITEGWPGVAMNKNADGSFSLDVPDYATKLVVNNVVNGVGSQSEDLWVGASTGATIRVAEYYNASVSYPQTSVTAHAKVPEHWTENGETIYLYSWNSSGQENARFPGVPMTAEEGELAGWYSTEMFDIFTNVIISNGSHDGHKQSINLTVRTGLEPWITVNDNTIVEENVTRYTASVNNGNSAEEEGFFFTPIRFMDEAYKLWMAVTVHAENEKPAALGSDIDVHSEVQMYKQITVLPANVVYYEDDFTGISYDQSTGNTFDKLGGGSGSLKQSVDQDMEYGQDPYYQGSDNDPYSGNSLHKIKVNNGDNIATFTFSGTGFEIIGNTNAYDSGMMMVKVYDAAQYAKYQAGELTSIEPHMQVPVINEYDNGANGGSDSIEQVPVIRISSITKLKKNADGSYVKNDDGSYQYDDLGYGKYTVEISGAPIYHFCGQQIKTEVVKSASCLTGGEAKATCSGCGETWSYKLAPTGHNYQNGKCACGAAAPYDISVSCKHDFKVSSIQTEPTCTECGTGTYTCELCGISYTDAVKPVGHSYTASAEKTNPSGYTYDALVCSECANPFVPSGKHYNGIIGVEEAYLYIDGVRIFKPYNGGVSDLYRPGESGAAFGEIRDMIEDKQIFVISTEVTGSYDDASGKSVISISGGMNTWTENRIGMDSEGNSWTGNTVSSVTEYIYAGPNNEAYLAAGQQNPSALAFYVKENVADQGSLQVAIRGIDYGTFFGNDDAGLNATLMLGVVTEDGSYGWKPLAEVISGTEQYYTIPYGECPYDAVNGRYQVVLQIANTSGSDVTGMVSFSCVKTNGVTIPTLSGDKFELTYAYDSNSLVDPINGETVESAEYVNFAMISRQMRANIIVLDEDPIPDNDVSDDNGTGDTGSDNTGSGDTGSDNTGSDNTGSDNTGSGDAGSDNVGGETSPATGDVSLIGLMVILMAALLSVVLLPKKLFRF